MEWLKLFTILIVILPSMSLRILGIFPHPGVTHFYFFHPIMRGLAEAGHDVTVVSQFPDARAPKNYKDIVITGVQSLHNTVELKYFENSLKIAHFFEFPLLKEWGLNACRTFLNSSAIQKILKSKISYDVLLLEQFNNDCMMAVAWKLKVPVIGLSSCPLMPYHYERIGSPDTPSYIPVIFLHNSEKMSFIQRLGNWITDQSFKMLYKYSTYPDTDKIIKQYLGDGIPPVEELVKQTSLMFLNQHYSLSGPQPRSPAVIELMGVHIKEPKPLDESLQQYLNSSENGVIFVSWGSMVKSDTMPEEKLESMLKVFKSLKENILWKWPNDTMPNKPDNVMIRKWLPQREILCHPKVKLFMAHGGSLGAAEAVHCGIPTIITPFYGDQYYNAAAFAHRGAGITLLYTEINEQALMNAIQVALHPNTIENARKLSYSFRNRQQSPIETAVWWVEHVAATKGAPLLKSHSVGLSAFVYHSFDVYATLLTGVLLCIWSWMWIIRKVCCSPKKDIKQKVH